MKIAVVIPCFRVKKHILNVIKAIGPEVTKIYVVDDCCPENSGDFVEQNALDKRVMILRNKSNLGVGGAVKRGYLMGLKDEVDILVKIDGDGQMNPALISKLIKPIEQGLADYTKGNRFYYLDQLVSMPKIRIFGNASLSFINKITSGYWNIFDPTNGFTAIHRNALQQLPLNKISNRYFFESDILFRLNTIRAVVADVPMKSCYGDEISGLRLHKIFFEFLYKHIVNFVRRIFYNYYLRDMSIASFELPIGLMMLVFGLYVGIKNWFFNTNGIPATAGTVMLSAVPIILGIQLLLAFLSFDINSVPTRAISSDE